MNYYSLINLMSKGGSSYDADAQAFLTATGITDLTISTAINNLVIGLKADGLWSKYKAIYPCVGGTAFTHKFNLKDPRDLDAAYRLTFTGSITHNSSGFGSLVSDGKVDTHLNAFSDLTLNDVHLSNYCVTQSNSTIVDMSSNVGADYLALYNRFSDLAAFDSPGSPSDAGRFLVSNTTSLGLFLASRTGVNAAKIYRNGSAIATSTNATAINHPNATIKLLSIDGGAGYFSNRMYAFWTIGFSKNDTDAVNYNNRVQTFQTALSRNV